jgi:hypothetical protein
MGLPGVNLSFETSLKKLFGVGRGSIRVVVLKGYFNKRRGEVKCTKACKSACILGCGSVKCGGIGSIRYLEC